MLPHDCPAPPAPATHYGIGVAASASMPLGMSGSIGVGRSASSASSTAAAAASRRRQRQRQRRHGHGVRGTGYGVRGAWRRRRHRLRRHRRPLVFTCCSSLRLCVGLVDYCHQDIVYVGVINSGRHEHPHIRIRVLRLPNRRGLGATLPPGLSREPPSFDGFESSSRHSSVHNDSITARRRPAPRDHPPAFLPG